MALFGPAGNAESFKAVYRKNTQIPEYLSGLGLSAYEYQCGRGVKIKPEDAKNLGALLKQKQIVPSLHAPYYISLSSTDPEKRDNSVRYILESARAVTDLGGTRIIVHAGSCASISREEALALAMDTMARARSALDENGYEKVIICPETMGKINQLGTLEEVLALCSLSERMLPCVDFGHLNARSFGAFNCDGAYETALDLIEARLGYERLKRMHVHFSKIAYTMNGGEKAHLTFEDTQFGPPFRPLAEAAARRGLEPTFICESAGTQAEDAVTMKQIYEAACREEALTSAGKKE